MGGAARNHGQMQLFKDVLDECGFMDLGFVGSQFTWSKHFADGHSIWEILDRGLANNSWFTKFPGSIVTHLLDREARLWSQQSRVLWLKHGDNNTRFFHTKAIQRHWRNLIRGIMDDSHIWWVQTKEIASVLTSYYHELFTTSNSDPYGRGLP